VNDNELLGALARSLEPPPSQPSEAELATFRDALAARASGTVVPLTGRARRLGRHRGSVAAAAAAIVLVAGGSAIAVGRNSLPGPVKVVAAAVGIDLDHAALDAARASETHLRNALAGGDNAAVATAAGELRAHMAKLDASDRKELGTEADVLLAQADALTGHFTTPINDHGVSGGSGSGGGAPAGSTSPGSGRPKPSGPSHPASKPSPTSTPTTELDDHHRGSTSTSEPDDRSGKGKGPPPFTRH
jgi:hypothetical protein